jgi:serine/threonine-protein kinase
VTKAQKKPWDVNWEKLRQLRGGGQGETWVVRRRGDTDGEYVLKVLRKQDDTERRKRMCREVEALRLLQHPAIPRVVEYNTDDYADLNIPLYFVANYIDGPTLEEQVKQARLRPDDAVRLVVQVAETLQFCHDKGLIHRDIKPDNIILRAGNMNEPFLIDFGQSFNQDDTERTPLTPNGQQLGNRFLHLPELQIDDSSKRDVESDISQVCALLLYALTGEVPGHLIDHRNLRPHQRSSAKLVLDQISSASLGPLFDKGFEHELVKRFRSFRAFKGRLYEVLDDLEHSEFEGGLKTSVTLEAITPEIVTVSSQPSLEVGIEPKRTELQEPDNKQPTGDRADALMFATLLGAWNEKLEGDRDTIKALIEGND